VPLHMLRDSQLLILFELSVRGAHLGELERRTALTRTRLEHDLACLYYAKALTTDERRAATPRSEFKNAAVEATSSGIDRSSRLWDESVGPPISAAPTTPVMLGRREDTTPGSL